MKALWIIYPFCSIFILVGAGLSFWTLRGMLKGRFLADWPVAPATIENCELKQNTDSEGDTSYEVQVRYSYEVLGQTYQGDQLHPAYSGSSFEGHHELHRRLKDAKVVEARYNQADPSEAYLLTGTYSSHLAAFFGGLLFFMAGLLFLLIFHFAIAGNSNYASGLKVLQ